MSETADVNVPLITRYRPSEFTEVFGNELVIAALRRAIQGPNHPHCYLLTGPSGLGKTTLARIIGKAFNAEIIEIDAASHSGVNDMRELVELSQHMSMRGNGTRMFLIDECHALSRSAWQAVLKLSEEPPAHVYIALCTTEPEKVPDTIRGQRAYPVTLKPLPLPLIMEYQALICEMEGWKVNNEVATIISTSANGSPRRCLTLLQSLHDAQSREEVNRVVTLLEPSETMIQAIQMILRGDSSWPKIRPLLERIDEDEFESASVHAGRYIIGALVRETDQKKAGRMFDMLNALTFPSSSFDKRINFFVALGRILHDARRFE